MTKVLLADGFFPTITKEMLEQFYVDESEFTGSLLLGKHKGENMNFNQLNITLPAKATDMLALVQKYVPGAVIAGGYLRDLYIGIQPKDIDIFIPFVEDIDSILTKIDNEISPKIEVMSIQFTDSRISEMHGAAYMPQSEITRVWDVRSTKEDNTPYQIIMLQKDLDIRDRISKYDFGFCQIYFDGCSVYATDAFQKDVDNKTFTLVHCEDDEQFARSMRRANKFKDKLPNWQFVNTTEFKEI